MGVVGVMRGLDDKGVDGMLVVIKGVLVVVMVMKVMVVMMMVCVGYDGDDDSSDEYGDNDVGERW